MGGATGKKSLRRAMKRRLSSVDPESAQSAGRAVADRVRLLPEVQRARAVLACWSFGVELPTHALIRQLADSGVAVFLPRIEREETEMTLHAFPCPMEVLSFGLEQPSAQASALDDGAIDGLVDAALVQGLAFDSRGYRLGYGGGYFDRFFARHPMLRLGLGFDLQRVPELPREAHDLPMHKVVTEAGVWTDGGAVPSRD